MIDETYDISSYKDALKKNGYTIIPNVYNNKEINEYIDLFNKWHNDVPNLTDLHSLIDYNGIYKHHQVGHQRFAWLARTNPKILNIFKQLWDTEELVSGFDGCCHYPSDYKNEDYYWIHTDQSSRKKGLSCYQSFLSLTNNSERTLVLYSGSHLLHKDYFEKMEIDEPHNWHVIDKSYFNSALEATKIKLQVKAGDLVIWDSRTFHQNSCGPEDCVEERLIQYLCYLPRQHEDNTEKQNKMRRKFYEKLRTTSHWPYPMNAVPEQANFYNHYNPENEIYIDYESLPKPDLNDMKEEIEKLL
jgi:hypothetical protein